MDIKIQGEGTYNYQCNKCDCVFCEIMRLNQNKLIVEDKFKSNIPAPKKNDTINSIHKPKIKAKKKKKFADVMEPMFKKRNRSKKIYY
jgi:hypothetical protein